MLMLGNKLREMRIGLGDELGEGGVGLGDGAGVKAGERWNMLGWLACLGVGCGSCVAFFIPDRSILASKLRFLYLLFVCVL